MALINDKCSCGREVIVRTGEDAKYTARRDGKQVIYANELTHSNFSPNNEYSIFRCEDCLEPISESCPSAAYAD